MGATYRRGLQIEREDNDGNYEPNNCKWATRAEQSRNKSNNVFLEYDGKRKTLTEWARELGISVQAIKNRITLGWSEERICSTRLTEMGSRNHVFFKPSAK